MADKVLVSPYSNVCTVPRKRFCAGTVGGNYLALPLTNAVAVLAHSYRC